jgi:hypothetical protein
MRSFLVRSACIVSVFALSAACGLATGVSKDYVYDLPEDAGRDGALLSGDAAPKDAGKDAGVCTTPGRAPNTNVPAPCWTCATTTCACELGNCSAGTPCDDYFKCINQANTNAKYQDCNFGLPQLKACMKNCQSACIRSGQ